MSPDRKNFSRPLPTLDGGGRQLLLLKVTIAGERLKGGSSIEELVEDYKAELRDRERLARLPRPLIGRYPDETPGSQPSSKAPFLKRVTSKGVLDN